MADSSSAAAGSVTYMRIIGRLTAAGITQEEVGQAVGASRRSVANWSSGTSSPQGDKRRRLLDLQYIVEQLSEVYTAEGVEIWLHSRNRNLRGQRPLDLLAGDQLSDVEDEVDRLCAAVM